MFITMHMLVIFRSLWNTQSKGILDGTGVSGFKSKYLLPLLISCDHQRLNDEVIEEGNLPLSRWIAKVASTEVYPARSVMAVGVFGRPHKQTSHVFPDGLLSLHRCILL